MLDRVKNRQCLEREICQRLLEVAIAAGFTISVDNGEEEVICQSKIVSDILAVMFSVDEETLILADDGKEYRIYLVYGNSGWDVIHDSHSSLEALLEPVHSFAESFHI